MFKKINIFVLIVIFYYLSLV